MVEPSMLSAVRGIGETVAEHAAASEQNRGLVPEVVDAIRPTGAFRMYVPVELNGPGIDAWGSLQVIEELAYRDGAAGWCSMIGSTTSLTASLMTDPWASELFGRTDFIAGGFAMPVGRARIVDGGLQVTGRWAWGSGTRHCDWIGGGCLVVDDEGRPSPRADGLAAPFVFFEPSQVSFIDNWDVAGLSGSGSGDYAVADAFVPEGRWAQIGSAPHYDNTLARFSFFGLLAAGVASCSLGIGRRSIDELVVLAATKKPQGSSRTLSERTPIQATVATAEARLGAASAFLHQVVDDAWQAAEHGDAPNDEHKRRLRLASTHAAQTGADVAEAMYKAGGGAAVYKTSPLQRCFRDAYVAVQHAMVADRTFEMVGRARLGLEVDTTMW